MEEQEYSYIGKYGLVKIIGGKHKGKFGYYDDDEYSYSNKVMSIVYFGEMFDNSTYYCINPKYITDNYTMKDLEERKKDISLKLFDNISINKRLALIEEKGLIDAEIFRRYEEYIIENTLKNKKVFLSHSSKDKSLVISVALDLKAKNIDTWLDAVDILPGESIISEINNGLSNCDFVLLFLSKNSVKSNWVTKEWETILWDEVNSNKVKIIPIKLDDCEIPKILQTKKYINFIDYNLGIKQLIDTLQKYEKRKSAV